ncbi:hypothetical protein FACS1894158_14060 [Betaproteobacteria bacterium]|nr:hypothetical protein FACS1894158_14060 [Betaproteobacteria bacterium]
MRLLVFPLDMDENDVVIEIATMLGIDVVGASSVMTTAGNKPISHFIRLPFVTDTAFDGALREAIEHYGITTVFSAHTGVWRHLDTLKKAQHSDLYTFTLCQPHPFVVTRQRFSAHEIWAKTAEQDTEARRIGGCKIRPSLTRNSYAALHRQFLSTPGQCDEGKLLALCDIARLLPVGDMVEVGCLYGRSSLALGFLAWRHGIGNLICVDPWRGDQLTDQGKQATLINTDRTNVGFESIFTIFLSTIATLENVAYIRAISELAHPVYTTALQTGHLESPGLGRITLSPQLSLVHIDGNHRYDHVSQDVALWSTHLARGGWLLLDDYLWAFGDGPRRVGNELLESQIYDLAFVSGDTLFLRRA